MQQGGGIITTSHSIAGLICIQIAEISTHPHHLSMDKHVQKTCLKNTVKSTYKSHLSIPSSYPLACQLGKQRIVDAALLTATPLFRQTTNATHQQSP